MQKPYLHEVFDEIDKAKTVKEKKELLQKQSDREAVRAILYISYNKDMKLLLPETVPPYKPSDLQEGLTDTRIDSEVRRFKYFIKGKGQDHVPKRKREALYLSILESLHAREADIMQQAFRHKFRLKGINRTHLNEVFGWNLETESKKKTKKDEKGNENSSTSNE